MNPHSSIHTVPQLTAKEQKMFVEFSIDECADYDTLKQAIELTKTVIWLQSVQQNALYSAFTETQNAITSRPIYISAISDLRLLEYGIPHFIYLSHVNFACS